MLKAFPKALPKTAEATINPKPFVFVEFVVKVTLFTIPLGELLSESGNV